MKSFVSVLIFLSGCLFLACGGASGAAHFPDPTIYLTPSSSLITVGQTQQFVAVPSTGSSAIAWSTSYGTISASGLYTAPSAAGDATVTATLKDKPSISATAKVVITRPVAVTSTTLADGTTGVNVLLSRITFQLSQPSVRATASVLSGKGTAPAFTTTLSGDVLTIQLGSALDFASDYAVTVSNIEIPFTSNFTTEPLGTEIKSDLSGDVHWTLSGSPFCIQNRAFVKLLDGCTLTIDPGVEVIGEIQAPNDSATISAIGTPSQHIRFASGYCSGILGQYKYCDFLGFNPAAADRWSSAYTPGSFDKCYFDFSIYPILDGYIPPILCIGGTTLSNSTLHLAQINNPSVKLYMLGGTIKQCYFDSIQFSNMGLGNGSHFVNNYVQDDVLHVPIWIDGTDLPPGTDYTVSHNTFILLNHGVVYFTTYPNSTTPIELILNDNYWGTSDPVYIQQAIKDHANNASNPVTVDWVQRLDAPDPLTPTAPPAARM
jgi:hypothetical protein